MVSSFLDTLDVVRHIAGISFIVNSGYRCPNHNRASAGSSNSAHLRGYAADIRAVNGFSRYRIVEAAIRAKVNRVGVYKGHVHLDTDPTLPKGVIWVREG